jgi:hypothetical protein
MATRWSENAAPSRHVPQIGYDVQSGSEDDLITQKDTNPLLRKAIQYLTTHGGSDSVDMYFTRVKAIDDAILEEFRNEGYPCDPQLFRQLKSLVHAVLAEDQIPDRESSARADSDVSMEELYTREALNREDEEPEYVPAGRQAPNSAALPPRQDDRRKAEVIETQYLYGGPNNEVEEWHKEFPAALPFGETLYMQEWESMKINYDLAESAKSLYTVGNPVISTNVPYYTVEARLGTPAQYESGSRFKIPGKVWTMWDQVKKSTMGSSSLAKRVDEFNQGGDLQEQRDRDYAPRVFLPNVSTGPKPRSKSLSALGTSTFQLPDDSTISTNS